MDRTELDGARGEPPKLPKGRKIPYPPDRDAPLPELRDWLSDAAGLPPAVRIDAINRPGGEPTDALTITLNNGLVMRCSKQSKLCHNATLQAFLASASNGLAIPPHLSPTEVGDFYGVICRLSAATALHDPVAELQEWFDAYVAICEPVTGSLLPADRYRTLERIRARPAYDRAAAENRVEARPVLLHADGARHVRAGEWLAWLRYGQGLHLENGGMAARMAEIGSTRSNPQSWNDDRSRKLELNLYSVPETT